MARTARPRHYLMCEPTYFDVLYKINPWMDPTRPTAANIGVAQWKRLHDLFLDLGHRVDLVAPDPELPDMVFAANGALVIDGLALVARFRHHYRAQESAAYEDWFRRQGWPHVETARHVNEGEGDFLLAGDVILAGTGFRSEPRAHDEVRQFFGREVLSLELVDPRFYHLDTALAVLDRDEIMYYPPAFSPRSRAVLGERFPDAILAADTDAEVFGLNAVSDGRHVVLPQQAVYLAAQLADRGYQPIGVEMSELLKAGGSVKCCTLELRGAPVAPAGHGAFAGAWSAGPRGFG